MGTEQFSWLHLTDFHFGLKGQKFLWPNLREPFFSDLAELHKISGPWQAVLFTGDLVQSGDPSEFADMQRDVLDRLWEELRKLGSGNAVLLAVPGNHDLGRPDGKADNAAVDTLLRDDGFSEIADKFWDAPNGSYRRVINDAFSSYVNWWQSTPQRPASVADGILPGDFACTLSVGERKIGIAGLNTTFLQLKGGDYRKRLVWDARQIHKVSGGAIDDWLRKHHVCLLLTHQGPDWLTPECAAHGETEIAPAGRFAAHLVGHMHETKILYLKTGGGEAVRLCQCHSVFGLEKYGDPPKTERSHGYAAGRIEFGGRETTLRLWPRIATRETGRWRFVPDYNHAELQPDQATKPEIISVRSIGDSGQALPLSKAPMSPDTQAIPRSTFIAIPKSTWPQELAVNGIDMPDSMLLRPESRVVRFHKFRMPLREAIISWALEPDDQPIKLRLQIGEGGSGKTRLLIEVCDELERNYGWRAGFVDRSQIISMGISDLLREEKHCLLVLDYAESRTKEIAEITTSVWPAPGSVDTRLS